MSSSLRPHGLQHAGLPYPSPSSGVCSNSCPLSQRCHPTISSSFFCPQSFPASGSFPMSQLFKSGGQTIGVSTQHQSFQWISRTDFLKDWLVASAYWQYITQYTNIYSFNYGLSYKIEITIFRIWKFLSLWILLFIIIK